MIIEKTNKPTPQANIPNVYILNRVKGIKKIEQRVILLDKIQIKV